MSTSVPIFHLPSVARACCVEAQAETDGGLGGMELPHSCRHTSDQISNQNDGSGQLPKTDIMQVLPADLGLPDIAPAVGTRVPGLLRPGPEISLGSTCSLSDRRGIFVRCCSVEIPFSSHASMSDVQRHHAASGRGLRPMMQSGASPHITLGTTLDSHPCGMQGSFLYPSRSLRN